MYGIAFAIAGLLTAASAWFTYRHRAGIDVVTGLAENMKWNYLAILCALLALVIWVALSILRLPAHKAEKPAKEEKKEEKKPVFVAECLDKPLPGYAFAFYLASFLLLVMAVVFFLLLTVTAFTPVHLLLFILSVATAAAFWRGAMIYVRRQTKGYDAVILPLPLIFLAAFGLFEYAKIMMEPETISYGLDVLAIAASLLSFYGFFSHYFGHPATRFLLFASLSAATLSAVAYFSRALLFFTEKIAPASADGSLYCFLAELMLFAAISIFSVAYAIILWDAERKK